jgi:pSer/pThr/pTyr-binding forkhead associated (FHA) protein
VSTDDAPYIIDLGSTNHTFINADKMILYEMYKVKDGDVVSFGPQTKIIYISAKHFYDFVVPLRTFQTLK